MKTTWPKALAWVLQDEGGNNDDPDDHGGRTSRGITQREYTAWLIHKGRPNGDVWHAPQADIDTIYHDEYWNPYCDDLPAGADYLLFNMNVNAGLSRAVKLLQLSIHVAADGRIGPITRVALANADAKQLILEYSNQSRAFYRSIATHRGQGKFLRGWLNRAAHVEQRAMTLI